MMASLRPHGQGLDLGGEAVGRSFDSTCIPQLTNCTLTLSRSEQYALRIEPGHLDISAGQVPIVGRTLLRYGIEWQIWYRALSDVSGSPLVDLAAARTTGLFCGMFSLRQKQLLRDSCDTDLYAILALMAEDDLGAVLKQIGDDELAYLRQFHGIAAGSRDLDLVEQEIVDCLAKPTEYLFTRGGDVRLRLGEESLLNVYGCQPFPRPAAFTFASSTATSVSEFAYAATEAERQRLISVCLQRRALDPVYALPSELARAFEQRFRLEDKGCEILLCPSGTDAQLIASAVIASQSERNVVNLVVASDETGSGTPLAVTGKHFSSVTGRDIEVAKGASIRGMVELGLLNLPIRTVDGVMKSAREIDAEVMAAVQHEMDEGNHAVLHVMDQSKLGCWAPTAECLQRTAEAYGNAVTVVVDACQMRLDTVDLHRYLDRGFIVLVTGSKFFTGPPFSGAVLIPDSSMRNIYAGRCEFPAGLRDYTSRHEWSALPYLGLELDERVNLGANLRWYAALAEMERFARVPEEMQFLGIDTFCRRVEQILIDTPFLEPLFLPGSDQYKRTGIGEVLSSRRTIYPFFVRSLIDGRVLSFEETRRIYELLNSDLTGHDADIDGEDRSAFAQMCHIGQPVRVVHSSGEKSAVLRISAGARLISESWTGQGKAGFLENISKEIAQIETIVKKISLLLDRPALLRPVEERA